MSYKFEISYMAYLVLEDFSYWICGTKTNVGVVLVKIKTKKDSVGDIRCSFIA